MKITKTQLTKLIKEELEKSLKEAEVVQEIYFPFIGGKLPDGEWSIRRKQMQAIDSALDDLSEEEQLRFADLVEGFLDLPDDQNDWLRGVPSALSTALEEKFDEWNKQLRKLSYNRHTKDEASVAMSKMDSVLGIMSKVVGGVAQQIAQEKSEDAAHRKSEDEKHARISAETEKERKAQRAHDDERRRMASSAQQDDSDDSFMGQHHLSNPGFAGTGNMGYGESLDRAKISKSELAQIIKEELENLLK
jgi:hypothetical protein|tara:strand:+ start:35 stop:778 length:744 start_codon:yes stop_codon:yes gene_type:complete